MILSIKTQGSFTIPTMDHAISNCYFTDAGESRPLRYGEGYSTQLHNMIGSFIRSLRVSTGPLAVLFVISLGVIYPFYRKIAVRGSHIGVKTVEGLPLTAYCYAASTIIRKVFVIRVVTSLLYSFPHTIHFSKTLPMTRFISSATRNSSDFFIQAAARLRFTGPKRARAHIAKLPAHAYTRPVSCFVGSVGKMTYCPSSKYLSGKINSSVGNVLHNILQWIRSREMKSGNRSGNRDSVMSLATTALYNNRYAHG